MEIFVININYAKKYFMLADTVHNLLSPFTFIYHIYWFLNIFLDIIFGSNTSNSEESFSTFSLI